MATATKQKRAQTPIFIKKLEVKNYKCFKSQVLQLNTPNDQEGSGLNLFLGENGTGKTSILEAISLLLSDKYTVQNKLDINYFQDHNTPIEIYGYTKKFECMPSSEFLSKQYFKSEGISFKANKRSRKERGKLLSSPFETQSLFIPADKHYIKDDESIGNTIDSRDLYFDNSRIRNGEINLFYFDKSSMKHLKSGNYKTTFDKICDELNHRFLRNLDKEKEEKLLRNITEDYFATVSEIVAIPFGEKLSKNFSDFFSNPLLKGLKIDIIKLLHPFNNAFWSVRKDGELKQLDIKSLGSGMEIILSLLLLKALSDTDNGKSSLIYLIDEPELHLHPKAQETLAELLLEESKTKQIIISSHSPFLYKKIFNKSKIFICSWRDEETLITNDNKEHNNFFPWSPTWSEINYKAFNIYSTDLHNELYGYLQYQEKKTKVHEIEEYLKNKCSQNKKWKKNDDSPGKDVTIHTFIRNRIHHSDNTINGDFTDQELKDSIEELIELIHSRT